MSPMSNRRWRSGPARTCRACRSATTSRWLFERDLHDLVGLRPVRRGHLDGVADLLADDGAGERRGDGQALGAHVGLVGTDDLVAVLFLGVLVDDGDGGAELHLLARELADVDDLGARDLVLELGDAALDEALALAGRVVFRVLREIAMLAGLGDLPNHGRPLVQPQVLQLLFQALEAVGGHWDFVHPVSTVSISDPERLSPWAQK